MLSPKYNRLVLLAALVWSASQFIVPWLFGSLMVAINAASGFILDPVFVGAFYNLVLGPVAVGAIAGYGTVLLLRSLPNLYAIQARKIIITSMAALILGIILLLPMSSLFQRFPQYSKPTSAEMEPGTFQSPGLLKNLATGFFTWIIPGILIGYAIGAEIHQQGNQLTGKQRAQIDLGWGLGLAVGGGLWLVSVDWIMSLMINLNNAGQLTRELAGMLPYAINGFINGMIGMWYTLHAIQAKLASPTPA